MQTVFPGCYIERTIYIHANWSIRSISVIAASNMVSISQPFLNKDLSKQTMALESDVGHTQINRTMNNIGGIFASYIVNDWNPYIGLKL